MKLTQIDLAEGRGGSQREVSASEAVARAEEACGGTLLLRSAVFPRVDDKGIA